MTKHQQHQRTHTSVAWFGFGETYAVSITLRFTTPLKQTQQCYCCFIFDHAILASLPADDKRVQFIYQSIIELRQALREMGGELIVRYGDPVEVIPVLVQELKIDAVFTNRDYEPQAKLRDAAVKTNIAKLNCDFFSYKDQVIFEETKSLVSPTNHSRFSRPTKMPG